MKMLLIASLILGSISAYADHHEEWKDMPLAERKVKITNKIDQRIKMLQENKSCVDGAKDDAALKACTQKMKEQRKEMKDKWKKHKKNK